MSEWDAILNDCFGIVGLAYKLKGSTRLSNNFSFQLVLGSTQPFDSIDTVRQRLTDGIVLCMAYLNIWEVFQSIAIVRGVNCARFLQFS